MSVYEKPKTLPFSIDVDILPGDYIVRENLPGDEVSYSISGSISYENGKPASLNKTLYTKLEELKVSLKASTVTIFGVIVNGKFFLNDIKIIKFNDIIIIDFLTTLYLSSLLRFDMSPILNQGPLDEIILKGVPKDSTILPVIPKYNEGVLLRYTT